MLNEFRQDPVSGAWVLFATGRQKGHIKIGGSIAESIAECPFEDPTASNGGVPSLAYLNGARIQWQTGAAWTTMVIANKFPALTAGVCVQPRTEGLFQVADAHGYHDLVITRDHDKRFINFSDAEVAEILLAYRERYQAIAKDNCGQYISIFHNKGKAAGATIGHNHSQIMSMPLVPHDIAKRLEGCEKFFKEHGKKAYDMLIAWELAEKKRIVYENEAYVAFCPYVSKQPYEIKIFPKASEPRFELTADGRLPFLANALSVTLKKMLKVLEDPDFNFYIHTAPVVATGANVELYSWHIEIVPRIKILGGNELDTNVFVNEVDPDEAAEALRKISI